MKPIEEFNPTQFNTYPKSKKKKDAEWDLECDDILTFDIEVSSGWVENGQIIGYRTGMEESYWNSLQPVSLCYIWQFSFNDEVYYGRELKDIFQIFDKLPNNIHFICYIHNLAYEFQFLNNYLRPWRSVFAREAHKPMYAISELYPNIEFRCSYILTRLSLDSWGKTLNFEKLHTLDYIQLRTPKTHLTDLELAYCKRDCEVVYKGIEKYREKYGHLDKIPLTQTGEVRRVLKDKVKKEKAVQKLMVKLLPKDAYLYSIMKQTFQGGYTHANFTLAGRTLHNGVAYDFASSYPAVMCSEKFPMTPFVEEVFEADKISEYAYLMKVRFTNVEPITVNHYISLSKAEDTSNIRVDNGRIISADSFTMWITEQDWDIITKTYTCEWEVLECYRSTKSYLPKVIVDYILDLYYNKTCYKGVEEMEDIYAQSKQFINSVFGMSVTDLFQDEITFDGNFWGKDILTQDKVNEELFKLQTNNKGKTFMAYQFGCWITAYARHNLWECLMTCDRDVAYCDTDSLKIRKEVNFDWYNVKIANKLKDACEFHHIDYDKTMPVDPKGKKHPLGLFEREENWLEFKTLGAKRYCYRTEDGCLHLTVSGINKDAVLCLKDDIENFNEETIFDKDYQIKNGDLKGTPYYNDKAEDSSIRGVHKQYSVYINDQIPMRWNVGQVDEYESQEIFGINIRPTSYSMGLVDEYLMLISLSNVNHLISIG